ncbi:hypothetical protein BDB13_0910 [Rhodococcus sp. OK302]|nr:hypothetical protein BDB13_0910 [Rhodococcus sp. OK302]
MALPTASWWLSLEKENTSGGPKICNRDLKMCTRELATENYGE